MKIIKFPLLLLLSIFLLTDCKKDSKTDNPDATADEITDWLKIDGAVKKSGNPPSPTVGAPVLTNLSPTTGGVTDGTFAFKFKASDDFEGIYLKVKGASSYLDIPFSTTGEKLAAGKNGIMGGARKDGIAYRDTTGEIIVILDLDDASNPEEFCYEYCLYDADNNVSNIVEVCVNIADWSEIGQLVGKWKFYKLVERSNLGEIAIQDFWWGKVDSLDCDDTVVNIRFYGSMEFDANGEFFEILKTVHDNGFSTECATLYGFNNNGESVNKVIGKWAYNQLTNSITVIIYSQIENEGSVFETVTNENYVFLSDYKFNLVNNEFVIEGENSDGSGYSSTYYKR